MTFKDHFSGHAGEYASYRPTYPDDLFAAIARLAPGTGLAWDVACGSGQAARALARHFDHVVATDASAEQIAHAERDPRVDYRVEPAEGSTLAPQSVDAVTIAQALHWLDLARFWPEVERVARPGAVVAAISYALMHVEGTDVDAIVANLYSDVVGAYWPPERVHVEEGLRRLVFPLAPLDLGTFEMSASWTLEELVGYLGTWSAVTRHRNATGADALVSTRARLAEVWGAPETQKRVRWPLSVRAGRVGDAGAPAPSTIK